MIVAEKPPEAVNEFPEFYDGPKLAAYLLERFPEIEGDRTRVLGDALTRRLFDWRRGSVAGVESVDRMCIRLGLVLDDDIPVSFGCSAPVKGRSSWERKRGVEMLREGWLPGEIAKQLGVNVRTVRRWKSELKGNA